MKPQTHPVLDVALFAHADDPLHQDLLTLEALVSAVNTSRGTRVFRDRIQSAVARLCDTVVEAFAYPSPEEAARIWTSALLTLRKAASQLLLMDAAGVLSPEQHVQLVAAMAQVHLSVAKRIEATVGQVVWERQNVVEAAAEANTQSEPSLEDANGPDYVAEGSEDSGHLEDEEVERGNAETAGEVNIDGHGTAGDPSAAIFTPSDCNERTSANSDGDKLRT